MKDWVLNHIPNPLFQSLKQIRSLTRKIRRSTHRSIGRQELTQALHDTGLCAGDVVMVHSSLRSIGNVRGGAETVIHSFMDVLTKEGTLMMVAYSTASEVMSNYKAGKIVDLRSEPVRVGQISESFRTLPNVYRSSHPFSSIIAWGRHAEFVTRDHDAHSRVCHDKSPIARLHELGGKIVGLGTTLGYVSFYHLVEDTEPGIGFDTSLPEEEIEYIDALGRKVHRTIRRYDPTIAQTRIETEQGQWVREYFEKVFIEKDIMRRFSYGESRAWVLECKPLKEELLRLATKGITIYTTQEQGEKLI